MTYEWTDDMGEVSGFGHLEGGKQYERACRQVIVQGLEWWDAHPDADPKFRGVANVLGLVVDDNPDATALLDAMSHDVVGGATGAMVHAALSAIFFDRKYGWSEYQAGKRAARRERESWKCKRCGALRLAEQVYCGAACAAEDGA